MFAKQIGAIFFVALLALSVILCVNAGEASSDTASAAQGLFSRLFSFADVADLGNGNIASTISNIPLLNLFQDGLTSMSNVAEPVTQLVHEGAAVANFIPAITGLLGGGGNMRRRLQDDKNEISFKNVDNVKVEEFFDCKTVQCNVVPIPDHICCRKDTVVQTYYKDSVSYPSNANTVTLSIPAPSLSISAPSYSIPAPVAYTGGSWNYGPSSTSDFFAATAKFDCGYHDCLKNNSHMCCWGCDRVDCSIQKDSPCCRVKLQLAFDYGGCQNNRYNCATFPHHSCCKPACDRVNCLVDSSNSCCNSCSKIDCQIHTNHQCCNSCNRVDCRIQTNHQCCINKCSFVDCRIESNNQCCKSCSTINCTINKTHECCLFGRLFREEDKEEIKEESEQAAIVNAQEKQE